VNSLDRVSESLLCENERCSPRRSETEQRKAVELMAYRYANGLDLWTGAPLRKEDLTNDLA
jgi:hypothetical protein